MAKIEKSKMPCNKPRAQKSGGKKSVVKACEGGKEKIVRFGDANMTIKKSDPARRKSFRARHNLGLLANTYAVTATPSGAPGTGYCSGMALSTNSFEIYFTNPAGALADMNFNFMLQAI